MSHPCKKKGFAYWPTFVAGTGGKQIFLPCTYLGLRVTLHADTPLTLVLLHRVYSQNVWRFLWLLTTAHHKHLSQRPITWKNNVNLFPYEGFVNIHLNYTMQLYMFCCCVYVVNKFCHIIIFNEDAVKNRLFLRSKGSKHKQHQNNS